MAIDINDTANLVYTFNHGEGRENQEKSSKKRRRKTKEIEKEIGNNESIVENKNPKWKGVISKSVEEFTLKDLGGDHDSKEKKVCWLMSPPCQPYTRNGKGEGGEDSRAGGLTHLTQLLESTKDGNNNNDQLKGPEYLFLENVKGFELSDSRDMIVNTLKSLDYEVQEFLLSPSQIGIPNSRLRYYLLVSLSYFLLFFSIIDFFDFELFFSLI